VSFYMVYSAQILKRSNRVWWLFPLFLAGFAFRGPLGLVIPTGVVCMFYLLEKDYKRFFLIAILSALLLAIASAALLSIAYHVGGQHFLDEVLQKQVFGRMQADAKTPAHYFYLIESFGAYAVVYPLAVFMLLGLVLNFNFSQTTRTLLKIAGWALIVVVGLSIPGDKKVRYILPAIPALALICGYLFVVPRERHYFYFLKRLFLLFCWLFPTLALGAIYFLRQHQPELIFSYNTIFALLIALQVCMFFMLKRDLLIFAMAVLALWTTIIFVIEPIYINLNRARDFVWQVEDLRLKNQAQLVFYREGRDGLVIKYLINMPQEVQPVFIKDLRELAKNKQPVMIVMTKENYEQVSKKDRKHLHMVMRGMLGREPVIVFSRNASHLQGES
jgi:hypothetical protein